LTLAERMLQQSDQLTEQLRREEQARAQAQEAAQRAEEAALRRAGEAEAAARRRSIEAERLEAQRQFGQRELEMLRQAGAAERAAAGQAPGAAPSVMGAPGYEETIRVHPSGVPFAPINIYENLRPAEVANLRRQEGEVAKSTRQKLQEETNKARQTKADMDVAEAALRSIEKKGGQPTGGIYGFPVVGQAMQAFRTSQDPDAARFRTVAAQMQRNAYVPGEGQISNFERELFAQANLDLGRPMQTNFDLIDANRIASSRTIERAQFVDRYFAVNRTLSGADDLWQSYLDGNPILIRDQAGEIVKNPNRANSYEDWFRSREGQRVSGGAAPTPGRAATAVPTAPTQSMELTRQDVEEQAEMNGISVEEAARRLVQRGYTIKD
jgi:hypothetical protein